MFANVVQPSIVSLFSSTNSAPLQLFSQYVDPSPALRSDSLIHLLNDATSLPVPPDPGILVPPTSIGRSSNNDEDDGVEADVNRQRVGRRLCQTVLHIQSPTLRTTYIRCPPIRSPPSSSSSSEASMELGLTRPWMHIQVCRLGEREWAFELGIADVAGRKGVIRCSTFQRRHHSLFSTQKEATVVIHHDPPLLHVPLRFPAASSQLPTFWNIISVNIGAMMPQFRIISAAQLMEHQYAAGGGERNDVPHQGVAREGSGIYSPLPSGALGSVTYVKVYANCRLRRIWFSENRGGNLPWEFELYESPE